MILEEFCQRGAHEVMISNVGVEIAAGEFQLRELQLVQGRQGAGRTTCSWFQLPERLEFGLKFGSSLMMYSLDPFNQA